LASFPDATFDYWLREFDQRAVASVAATLDSDAALERVRRRAVAARPLVAAAGLPADERALSWVGAMVGSALHAPVVIDSIDRGSERDLERRATSDASLASAPDALSAAALRPEDGLVPPSVMLRPVVVSPRRSDLDTAIAAAVEGEARAIGTVLTHVRPLVVRYCRARIGRQERSFASADDLAQEVCLAVLTALPSYRDNGRPFLAFVYGIAAHKIADARREAAQNRTEPVGTPPDGVDDASPDPEQRALRGQLSGEMADLLKVLPPRQREIVILRVVVGLSAEETADAVGSTPGAVRVAQHRALTRLRAALPDWYNE
jgi:RNA polymerase sigma-70 factor (ECF subfamily)